MKAGHLGTIARYVASEAAPVAADTLNYVAGATREGRDSQPFSTSIAAGVAAAAEVTPPRG